MTNQDRTECARAAVEAFSATQGYYDELIETRVVDLIADLFHLCDAHQINRGQVLDDAALHYHAELEDER